MNIKQRIEYSIHLVSQICKFRDAHAFSQTKIRHGEGKSHGIEKTDADVKAATDNYVRM